MVGFSCPQSNFIFDSLVPFLAYHMKCIDPWLLNNRRQCPVCKRYVFPNQDHSDEEESSGHAATERTPLIRPSDEDSTTTLPGDRFAGRNRLSDETISESSNV